MIFMDLKGTTNTTFQIQKGGPRFTNVSGELVAQNAAGGAYANLIANILKAAADYMTLNADAAGAGADWEYNIKRPTVGMASAIDFILPPDYGAASNVLTTDGSGNLSWGAPSLPSALQVDVTALNWNDASPVAMFTLPANAIIDEVKVIIDAIWDGTPTLDVGIVGTTDKYLDQTEVDLKSGVEDAWAAHHNKPAPVAPEAIIATYAKGGATFGDARILTKYVIPS